jgi:transcriptional regulator with XRE-family HTH domain
MHLSDFMTLRSLSDDQVAIAIGRSRATVSRIRRRKVRPDWETILELRKWSKNNITAADFEQMQAAE